MTMRLVLQPAAVTGHPRPSRRCLGSVVRHKQRYGHSIIKEVTVVNCRQVAGLVGPAIVAMVASEFPLVQPHLYDAQIPPVVYLSGVLMFVGGLAIVRAHNVWARNWTVLVTLSGWFFLMLGLTRMFAASQYGQASAHTSTVVWMAVEGCLLIVGLIITCKAYTAWGR
jgi:hypothetical protein